MPPLGDVVDASGRTVWFEDVEANAWMAHCLNATIGLEVTPIDSPTGGLFTDRSQPGYDQQNEERAEQYCLQEGTTRGHLSSGKTDAELRRIYPIVVDQTTCLGELGFSFIGSAPPGEDEFVAMGGWDPFSEFDAEGHSDEEIAAAYTACGEDRRVRFTDDEK